MRPAALILASGSGSRLQAALPKAYLPLAGTPLLLRCARRLAQLQPRPQLVIAIAPEHEATHLAPLRDALEAMDTIICHGGSSRQESMARALAATPEECDLILVHDAARPFFPLDPCQEAMRQAQTRGAALLAVPVPDTLKRATAVEPAQVEGTVDRRDLWQAQTPQVIQRPLLQRALRHATVTGFVGTDDASLVEHLGEPIVLVQSSPQNFKITHPEDLSLASHLAQLTDP